MKTFQRNKLLQSLIGFVAVVFILWAGMFSVNKIKLLESPGVSALEIAFCVIYPILFGVFMIGVSLISKKHSMEYLFYPVFWISFTSGAAAYIMCCLEGSVSLLFWGIILVPLAKPFGDISKGMEKLLEHHSGYSDDLCSYVYQWDCLVVFLGVVILSLIVYQSTVKTEKQREKYLKWRLNSSTETLAKIIIGAFGGYALLADIYFTLPYENRVSDVLWVLLMPVGLGLTMTFIIYVLPIALCGILVFKGIEQAKDEKNLRKIFNPYIISAVIAIVAGCKRIFDIVLTGF